MTWTDWEEDINYLDGSKRVYDSYLQEAEAIWRISC